MATPRVAPARRNPHPRSNEPAKASKKFQPTNHMQADLQASRLKLIDCRAVEAKLRSPLRPQPHSTTHWEPCRFVPERPLSDRCRRRCTDGCERLGLRCGQRPILARLRRADGRWYGRPGETEGQGCGRQRFRAGRCTRPSPWTTRVQRNVRARDRWQRTASLAGGSRSCLRAFAAGRLPGDCAGGAARRAAVQPAPRPACRAGAMDRRAGGFAGDLPAGEVAGVCRPGCARQLAGAAR